MEKTKPVIKAPFMEPPALRDGELELDLVACAAADVAMELSPCYNFSMRVGGETVGRICFRLGDSRKLVMYGGHIGYSVFPKHQGHHYAERASRLLFELARRHGMKELWITCNPDNAASRRTCERLQAVLVEIVPVPEIYDMYRRGEKEKCRYLVRL